MSARKLSIRIAGSVFTLLLCCSCRAPEDRTEKIEWQYQWDADDPIARIVEDSSHQGLPNHGAVLTRPVVGQDGTVYLLRPHEYREPKGPSLVATGPGRQWEIRAEGGICNSPAIADDGTIIFGTQAGASWAVSPDGKKQWTYSFPTNSSYPAVDFGGGATQPARSPACSQPAVAADGTSYWMGHGVVALSKFGLLRWTSEQNDDFLSSSIAPDGTVYALANGGLFALAPDSTEHWKFPLPKSKYFWGAIAIGQDGDVYLTTLIDTESAITVLTPLGNLKQRYKPDSGSFVIGTTLIAADGTVCVTTNTLNRTYATAWDSNGRLTWTGPQESETLGIGSDGTLYIREVSDLLALGTHREILWRVRLPENPNETEAHDPTKAVTIASDGKLFIGDFRGRLGTLDAAAGLASTGWPARFHDARNTSRAGAN